MVNTGHIDKYCMVWDFSWTWILYKTMYHNCLKPPETPQTKNRKSLIYIAILALYTHNTSKAHWLRQRISFSLSLQKEQFHADFFANNHLLTATEVVGRLAHKQWSICVNQRALEVLQGRKKAIYSQNGWTIPLIYNELCQKTCSSTSQK